MTNSTFQNQASILEFAPLSEPADVAAHNMNTVNNGRAAMDEAFSRVVEDYADFAYGVAYRMLRSVHDAEDAVQEAFISAYRSYHRFKGQSKVSTWIYRIVVNTCLMKIRKEKSRSKYLTESNYDDAIVVDWGNHPEQSAINSELRTVVEAGLDHLAPDLRSAVLLRDVQGLTTEEGAAASGVSLPAFKSRLRRGRVMLREYLAGYLQKEGQPAVAG